MGLGMRRVLLVLWMAASVPAWSCNTFRDVDEFELEGDDEDGDGLPDDDGDGLTNEVEAAFGLNPNDIDSDDDAIHDGEDGLNDDDGDGLIGARDPDNDNDGLLDGLESSFNPDELNGDTDLGAGHFFPDVDPTTQTNRLGTDSDEDGLRDGAEDFNHDGKHDPGETDPNNGDDNTPPQDTDGDGLADSEELTFGGNPAEHDTDFDGVADGAEANWMLDTDGDGLLNVADADSDEDRSLDGEDNCPLVPNEDQLDSDGDGVGDACIPPSS